MGNVKGITKHSSAEILEMPAFLHFQIILCFAIFPPSFYNKGLSLLEMCVQQWNKKQQTHLKWQMLARLLSSILKALNFLKVAD